MPPRKRQHLLSDTEVEGLFKALSAGEGRLLTEIDTATMQRLLDWAIEVKTQYHLMMGLVTGEFDVRWHDGDWQFRLAQEGGDAR